MTQISDEARVASARLYAWCGLVVGLLWLAYIFVKYNSGPFVSLGEAVVDCVPLVIVGASIVMLSRTSTPSACGEPAAQETEASSESETAIASNGSNGGQLASSRHKKRRRKR